MQEMITDTIVALHLLMFSPVGLFVALCLATLALPQLLFYHLDGSLGWAPLDLRYISLFLFLIFMSSRSFSTITAHVVPVTTTLNL